MIKKEVINEAGDYRIDYNGKYIKCKGVIEIYSPDDDLTERLNPNIITLLESDDCQTIEYTPAVETIEDARNNKLWELREKRSGTIDYIGAVLNVSDIQAFTPLLLLEDSKINDRLPIETDGGLMIEDIAALKSICELYVDHIVGTTKQIVDCKKAKTKEDIEKI
jgi:hypothetical protein